MQHKKFYLFYCESLNTTSEDIAKHFSSPSHQNTDPATLNNQHIIPNTPTHSTHSSPHAPNENGAPLSFYQPFLRARITKI